jgi:hypothetical protein
MYIFGPCGTYVCVSLLCCWRTICPLALLGSLGNNYFTGLEWLANRRFGLSTDTMLFPGHHHRDQKASLVMLQSISGHVIGRQQIMVPSHGRVVPVYPWPFRGALPGVMWHVACAAANFHNRKLTTDYPDYCPSH